jgi:MAF protein
MRIILASQSPFRRKALELLRLKFEVIPSNFDETSIRDPNPEKLSILLAEAKAKEVGKHHKNAIIISSDYFVEFQGKIYEKPSDIEEARQMLKTFSGNTIDNINSICVYNSNTKKLLSAVSHCYMRFRQLTDAEIQDYISRYPVTTFAGAFDTAGAVLFSEQIDGEPCYIYGLPLSKLIIFLKEMGIKA